MTSSNKKIITVLVAADNAPEAASIAGQIDRHDDLSVLATAMTPAELEELLAQHPDLGLLVTDVVLSNKDVTPILAKAVQKNPKLEVIVYTAHAEDSVVMRAVQAGASGYLLKGGREDIVSCIRLLASGGSPVSPSVVRCVLRALRARQTGDWTLTEKSLEPERKEHKALSQREHDILVLLAKGLSFAEIGNLLNISPHTVTAHVKKLYRKLQVHSRAEAVYEASCLGVLPN
ncbi:MAG TPA: response regulator transcription factor [Candidatus Sutterella merdavium]|jgi:DNA-binding NarL/FixJ family response regulator|nr:response regulator transcription factor [Candidatus Sutterella merdavium]